MFSSRSFYGFQSYIRSLVHVEFIFVFGVRKCSNFILLHVVVQFSEHHFFEKKTLFSIVYSCLLCPRLIDCECIGLFLYLLSSLIDLFVCFCAYVIVLVFVIVFVAL